MTPIQCDANPMSKLTPISLVSIRSPYASTIFSIRLVALQFSLTAGFVGYPQKSTFIIDTCYDIGCNSTNDKII